ncbi:MAG: radical SAM protein [Deltaproteobacteria bacterium]|nr:MAG: radical SAM protein [Deltaproteobacteria bacterium]
MTRTHSQQKLNIATWIPKSTANGPGERFVLWLQGCNLACPGCWNPNMWKFKPRHLMTIDETMSLIKQAQGIEGVTITGGEPFAQADALLLLAQRIRQAGLSLFIFTGYELEELSSQTAQEVLTYTDILITGRYKQAEQEPDLRWRGSRNQQIHFLSSRYSEEHAEDNAMIEIFIDTDANLLFTGFPNKTLLSSLANESILGK